MAHRRPTAQSAVSPPFRPRPLSADASQLPPSRQQSSTLLSLIPSMVKSRIPRLHSLRRTVSMYGMRARGSLSSEPDTPPDEYSAMILSRTWRDGDGAEMLRADLLEELGSSEEDEGSRVKQQQRKSMELTEGKSGIGWKFAGQGLSLLSLTITESGALSEHPDSKTASPAFARQLYIHALSYFLRGLPTDLTTEEALGVRSALPTGVVSPMRIAVSGEERHLFYDPVDANARTMRLPPPSVLHRTLAAAIINFFIFVQFLLPYVKVLLQAAYEYERSHRISEKVLASSIDTVDSLGRIGRRGGGAIWGSSLAHGLGEVLCWVVDGVSGGIQEGLGEGMVRFGMRKEIEGTVREEL